MDNIKEQTYWNKFINDNTINTFNGWVGNYNTESKNVFYKFLNENNITSVLDVGCGTATIYDGIQQNCMRTIKYIGVDSCDYFVNMGKNKNVIKSDIRNIPFNDDNFEVVFGRHILEHQSDFESTLKEMIRLSNKFVVHIFFLKPSRDGEIEQNIINYDNNQDLYHNIFSKKLIELFLQNNIKVKSFKFENINIKENMLVIEV